MLSEVRTLLNIQEIDQEMIELNHQLAQYPAIWDEVKQHLAKRKEQYDNAVKSKDRHQKERRRVEQKLRLFSDDLRRYQTLQSSIKTAKEYEAINSQIDQARKKINQCEEQGLALIDKDPELEVAMEEAEKEFKKIQDTYKNEKERIRAQFNEKKDRLEKLKKERDKVAKKVDPEVLAAYQTVYKRYPGNSLVPVRGNSCTGCHWQALPNHLVQLHSNERLTYCNHCGRILTEDEDFVPAEVASK